MAATKKPTPTKGVRKLKTPDLVFLFDVTHMTLLNWRKGSVRKTRPLPCDIGPNGEVTFAVGATKKWAKENGLLLKKDPALYLVEGKTSRKRPGPKPREVDLEERAKTERARDKERIESKHAARKEPKPQSANLFRAGSTMARAIANHPRAGEVRPTPRKRRATAKERLRAAVSKATPT